MIRLLEKLERSLRRRLQAPGSYESWREARALARWEQAGRPAPPPHAIKVRTVLEHATRFDLRTLVETGTYLGDMIDAVRARFDTVHSIELAQPLYEAAAAKFAAEDSVHIHQGDSGEVLAHVLASVDTPCLFWLDGHFSDGITARGTESTPILRELEAISAHPVRGHVILIDDARCFDGEDGYPTIDELRERTRRFEPEREFRVADDIIRIHGPGTGDGARDA